MRKNAIGDSVAVVAGLIALGSIASLAAFLLYARWTNNIDSDSGEYPASGLDLIIYELVFYVILALSLAGPLALGYVMARRAGLSPTPILAAVAFVEGLLLIPGLAVLTHVNSCGLGVSFPIPGSGCD
jgi:hypothetical protein